MDADEGSWKRPLRTAVVQTELKLGDIDRNLEGARKLVDELKDRGEHDLLVFPEMFTSGFDYEHLEEIAERSPEVLRSMMAIALDTSSHLMFTLAWKDQGRIVNRAFLMDGDGEVIGHYDKTHLFSPAGEDNHFRAGSRTNLLKLRDVSIGPLICYEIRYPEMSRRYALEGAHVLVYMAQWPEKRIFQWELLLRARAIENQCYVVGVNITGSHGRTDMGGHSMIVSPFGEVDASLDKGPGWAASEMDPARMYRFRRGIPALEFRRPDLY